MVIKQLLFEVFLIKNEAARVKLRLNLSECFQLLSDDLQPHEVQLSDW